MEKAERWKERRGRRVCWWGDREGERRRGEVGRGNGESESAMALEVFARDGGCSAKVLVSLCTGYGRVWRESVAYLGRGGRQVD